MQGPVMACELLTQRKVNKLLEAGQPGKWCDGKKLYLQILREDKDTGSYILRYRYRAGGKDTSVGLGSARILTLAQAREKARELNAAMLEGKDPRAELQKVRNSLTFEQVWQHFKRIKKPKQELAVNCRAARHGPQPPAVYPYQHR